MSKCRQHALIPASLERVWELVGNPARHPDWWPRVLEVRGESFDTGDVYVQVTRHLLGAQATSLEIDRLDDMRELSFHCRDTGMYSRWLLTPAREDTFVEAELGMDPANVPLRFFDATAGRIYFRRWLEESLDALAREAAQR